MYEHALATLLLAEALGEYERPGLQDALRRAVDLIVRAQNEEGGWRYEPVPRDADITVTVTQLVALRAAGQAGIAVPKRTIDAAVRYVKRCAAPGGGFLYQIGVGEPAYARSAAGTCAPSRAAGPGIRSTGSPCSAVFSCAAETEGLIASARRSGRARFLENRSIM